MQATSASTRAVVHPLHRPLVTPTQAPLPALFHTDTLANTQPPPRYNDPLEDCIARAEPVRVPMDPKARAAAMDTLNRLCSAYQEHPPAQRHEVLHHTSSHPRLSRRVRLQ